MKQRVRIDSLRTVIRHCFIDQKDRAGHWLVAVSLLMLCCAPSSGASYLYVSSSEGTTVSVIGTHSNSIVATIHGSSTSLTPDGAFVYIVDGELNTTSIVDTRTNEAVATLPFSATPVFTPNGATAYFGIMGTTIVPRNTTTGTFGTPITVPNFSIVPSFVTPDGQVLYAFGREVADSSLNKLFVISTATNAVVSSIEVPSFSLLPAAVSPNGEFVYAFGTEVGTHMQKLFVIATSTNTVVDTISPPADRAFGAIAFSLDGSLAYVSTRNLNFLNIISAEQFIEVIDVATHSIVSTITSTGSDPLASGINSITLSSDGSFLYVAQGNQLFFIDLSTNTTVGSVQIDTQGPADYVDLGVMALTPDGSRIYVIASSFSRHGLGTISSRVYIIDAARRNISNSIAVPSGSSGGPALSPERACGEDFTMQTLVEKSAFSQFLFPQLQVQFVAVFNGRTQGIPGPVTLFLNNIQNANFVGNNASSNCYAPAGTRYTTVSAGPDNVFSPGEIVIIPLLFLKTGPGPITYSHRVVSGAPGQ